MDRGCDETILDGDEARWGWSCVDVGRRGALCVRHLVVELVRPNESEPIVAWRLRQRVTSSPSATALLRSRSESPLDSSSAERSQRCWLRSARSSDEARHDLLGASAPCLAVGPAHAATGPRPSPAATQAPCSRVNRCLSRIRSTSRLPRGVGCLEQHRECNGPGREHD